MAKSKVRPAELRDAKGRTADEFRQHLRDKAMGILLSVRRLPAAVADLVAWRVLDFWETLPLETREKRGLLFLAETPVCMGYVGRAQQKKRADSYRAAWERIIRAIERTEAKLVGSPGLTGRVARFIEEQRQLMDTITSFQKHGLGIVLPPSKKQRSWYPFSAKRLVIEVDDILQDHGKTAFALLQKLGVDTLASNRRTLLCKWRREIHKLTE